MIKRSTFLITIVSLGLLIAGFAGCKSNQKYEPYTINHQKLNHFWEKGMYGYLLSIQNGRVSDVCIKNITYLYKEGALVSMDNHDLLIKNKKLTKKAKDLKTRYIHEYNLNVPVINENTRLKNKIAKQKKILFERKYVMPTLYILSVAFAIFLALFIWGYTIKKRNNVLLAGESEVENKAKKVEKQRQKAINAITVYEHGLKELQEKEEKIKEKKTDLVEREKQCDDILLKFDTFKERVKKYEIAFEKCCDQVEEMKGFVRSTYKNNPKKTEKILYKIDKYINELRQEVK